MSLLDALTDGHRIADLSQPLENGMPSSPTHPPFRFALAQRHGDVVREDGLTGSHELIVMGGHVGTHMDAVSHVAADGVLHGGVPVAKALERGRYRVGGIEAVPPILCRGVLFDIPRLREVPRLGPGEAVTAEDLAATGLDVHAGDVALVRTGWAQLWDRPADYLGGEGGVPGLDASGAEWLAERGVRAVGGDTIALEQISPEAGLGRLPVHRILLQENGINIIEVMNLEELAAAGPAEFLFVCAPLPVVGATGAPVRPLAVW
ncbi:cyclase family protein [Amycolatopsis thermoflava]|uniref:cyclase family protein n=1 Tax=Amycolatopsis thermoflava TaxID=84480 RepID=UPI003EC072BC